MPLEMAASGQWLPVQQKKRGRIMAKDQQITIQNVITLPPEDIFAILYEGYSKLTVPEYVDGPEDLDRISQLLGWCTNSKSYLASLEVYLDIATRNAKKNGDKNLHAEMVCRKNIIKTFKDMVADAYSASSRQATIYFEQRKELEEEKRNNNVQYGRAGYGTGYQVQNRA